MEWDYVPREITVSAVQIYHTGLSYRAIVGIPRTAVCVPVGGPVGVPDGVKFPDVNKNSEKQRLRGPSDWRLLRKYRISLSC